MNGGFCCEIAVTVPGLLSIILIQISCSLIFGNDFFVPSGAKTTEMVLFSVGLE